VRLDIRSYRMELGCVLSGAISYVIISDVGMKITRFERMLCSWEIKRKRPPRRVTVWAEQMSGWAMDGFWLASVPLR
jgi:hypothetical protein